LRLLVSGMSDKEFFDKAHSGTLCGFCEVYLGRLIRCHACTGFWVGIFLSLLHEGFIHNRIANHWTGILFDGFLLSAFNFVFWIALRRLGAEEL
jgi:hypothetical protein